MMYLIDGKKLKHIIKYERGLKMKPVSKRCGVGEDYISKAIELGRMNNDVIQQLHDKYEINPVRYVIGWKGGTDNE